MPSDYSNKTKVALKNIQTQLVRLLTGFSIGILILNSFLPSGPILIISRSILGWMILLIFIIMPLSPVISVLVTIVNLLTGRVHIPKNRMGETVEDEDGQSYTVFRQITVDPQKGKPVKPGALLTLRFRVTNMSTTLNKFYSLLPLALYIGDPGFRSKLFTIQGEQCQSIYEWDTVEDAQNYLQSFALKTILLRSVIGSFKYQILDLNG